MAGGDLRLNYLKSYGSSNMFHAFMHSSMCTCEPDSRSVEVVRSMCILLTTEVLVTN